MDVDIDLKGSVHLHLWGHHIRLLGISALAAVQRAKRFGSCTAGY